MNTGKYVFSEIMELVHWETFKRIVTKYKGNYRVRSFTCWHQFLCMSFGQLTHRESLRDIVICLKAHKEKHYRLGLTHGVSKSTLSDANERRDWRIYFELAQHLIKKVRKLYQDNEPLLLDLDEAVYALDSTTIELCLSVFWWAKFRRSKAAIKLHTLLDLRDELPDFVCITDGLVHDVNILDLISFQESAFYLMDRAYLDFARLLQIHLAKSYFVIRAKSNFQFVRLYSRKVDKSTGLRCDQTIRLKGFYSRKDYPEYLRRIKFYDKEHEVYYVFLTNNFEHEPQIIATLYKQRWQIELFFKWIKQNLKIKRFWGENENAVRTQIWIAIATYTLVALLKKKFNIQQTMHEILQILSVSAFDKTPVNQLFTKSQP